MDEARIQAYLELIQALLSPQGQEPIFLPESAGEIIDVSPKEI